MNSWQEEQIEKPQGNLSLGTEEEQVQNGAVSEEVHDRGTLNWMLECSISALLLPLTGYVTLGK